MTETQAFLRLDAHSQPVRADPGMGDIYGPNVRWPLLPGRNGVGVAELNVTLDPRICPRSLLGASPETVS